MEIARKIIQIVCSVLTNGYLIFPWSKQIYQGPLKVICSPGLNCYSCPASTTYCPIGAIQQLLLGVRFSMETGAYYFGSYVIGSIGLIASLTGRLTCGWLCPFGFIQEVLYKIPTQRKVLIKQELRYVKYIVLILMVFIFPVMITDEWGMGKPWFCKYLCPAGTLEAGIPMLFLQPELRGTIGKLFINKLFWMISFLLLSVISCRPFCKIACPLGAFYGFFNKFSILQLHLNKHNCTDCGACKKICPMDIQFNKTQNSPECILCMKCMTSACKHNAISVHWAGTTVVPQTKNLKQHTSPVLPQ